MQKFINLQVYSCGLKQPTATSLKQMCFALNRGRKQNVCIFLIYSFPVSSSILFQSALESLRLYFQRRSFPPISRARRSHHKGHCTITEQFPAASLCSPVQHSSYSCLGSWHRHYLDEMIDIIRFREQIW